MPRIARNESETMYYHVMTRGINKEKIFKSDNDKNRIMQILESKLNDIETELMAYCIMDNHLHLALRAEMNDLTNLMKRINITYAMYYNKKNNRIGPVFQDRFKSENILDESYLNGAIRYIHNNPVDANVTQSPEIYKWSSMREYLSDESFLIGNNVKEIILNEHGSKNEFKEFHREEDNTKFLEIKEEEKQNQEKAAERIIAGYFKEKGIEDSSQVKEIDDLIVKLIDEGLSYRKVARLTNSSLNKVYQANKKNRP